MKKAKVSKGIVRHVWPWVKTLKDGRQVVKTMPLHYGPDKDGNYLDCIVDVPDDVQQNWVWREDLGAYGPRIKRPFVQKPNYLWEVLAERLGTTYADLLAEAKARKAADLANRDDV